MTVYALAGRRPDPPDAEARRFPLANRELVTRRVGELFIQNNATALVASAACGADLIALGAAGLLQLRRFIVLPFDRTRFRETSVTDRPGDWGADYDRILDEVAAAGGLAVLDLAVEGDDPYRRANEKIIETAAGLASDTDPVHVCLVWEGAPRGPDDITYQLAETARARGWPVDEVLTV